MSFRILSFAAAAALALAPAAFANPGHGGHGSMSMSMSGDHGKGGGHDESASGHSHEMAMVHGGTVTMTENHHFEVLCTDDQVRLYAYDGKQQPLRELKNVKAKMTIMDAKGTKKDLSLTWVPPDPDEGRTQGYFMASHDLGLIEPGSMKAMVRVEGLAKEPISFRTALSTSEPMVYMCPMKDSGPAEDPGTCPKCGMEMKRMMGEGDMHGHGEGMKGHGGMMKGHSHDDSGGH